MAIKAVIDAEIESKCGKQYERSSRHLWYRHGKQKAGYVIINGQKKKLEKPGIVERGKNGTFNAQGGTENAGLVNSIFDDMESRSVKKDRPILFVINGSKAIHAAIVKRYDNCFIQQCREHKRRTIIDHAPVSMNDEVEKSIHDAYA